MHVVLIRHATREMNLSNDANLSPEGFEQARRLVSVIKSQALPPPCSLYSSPKSRCQQTLQPLANSWSLELQIIKELDESFSGENHVNFRQRIQSFLDSLSDTPADSAHYVCSHSDWLQEAFSLIPSADQDHCISSFPNASPFHFEVVDGLWKKL